ncbi:hypothetical protein AB0I28_28485 [Phytomonospora sp. NPDC050363]|uniref:hypothetical protein n=1 Tax=Phytomonospora sp. NPDC050363 TaxID=3155642 RepID=UPI0033DB210D
MAETFDDGGASGEGDWKSTLERLLDLATDRHIEDNPQCVVVTEALQPYREQLGASALWGHATTDPASLRSYLLEQAYAFEYDDMVVFDMPDGRRLSYYLRGGAAWLEVRSTFDGVKAQFEAVMSYSPDSMAGPYQAVKRIRENLTPVTNLSEEFTRLTGPQITDAQGELQDYATFNQNWGAYAEIGESLVAWRGMAAEIFNGAYINLIPSILTGQTLVAKVLEDSLDIAATSYTQLRLHAVAALNDAVDILALYPAPVYFGDPFDWATTLDIIAAGAGTISGVTGFEPGAGTAVSVVFALVAGAASLAKTVIGSPEHVEAKRKPVKIEGDSAREIASNFELLIRTYQNTVHNTEETLRRTLAGFQSFVDDRSAPGVVVRLTWGGDYPVSQRNTFFETMRPSLGDLNADTGFATISGNDYMGEPPHSGAYFATDLQRLLQSGHQWLPDLAANYHGLSGSGAANGVEAAFTRDTHGYSVSDSESYAGISKGVLYPQWIVLYDELMSMLKTSGDNLDAAASGLIAAAIAYAEQDDAAAKELKDTSAYYKEA